jgi:hypothetical protein
MLVQAWCLGAVMEGAFYVLGEAETRSGSRYVTRMPCWQPEPKLSGVSNISLTLPEWQADRVPACVLVGRDKPV